MARRAALIASATAIGTISTVSIPLTDAAIGFTQAELDDAQTLHMELVTNNCRYAYEGGAAVVTSHELIAGQPVMMHGNQNLQQLRLIRDGASNATVRFTLIEDGVNQQ